MTAEALDRPKRLPLVTYPENRGYSTAKDARLVNGFVERSLTGDFHLYKRVGLSLKTQLSGNGYGTYNWQGNIYAIFDSTLYKNGVSAGTVDATGGVYHFTSCLGATPRLVLGNGVKAYTYDGTTLAQITDVDFPTTFYKGWAFLDDTIYVMASPNHIQGSDLSDPTSWNSLNTIDAKIEQDFGIGLGKQLSYVLAFKQWTTEIFYDAVNPPPASPLTTVPGQKLNWGCASIDTLQEIDGILFWVAINQKSSAQVIMLDNLRPTLISTPEIERLLDEANFSTCFSWSFKDAGHWFYGFTVKAQNLTLVYDVREKLWAQWTDKDGNYFPIVSVTYDSADNSHVFQHETNGKLYIADSTNYTDDGDLITVDIYTPNFDAGTRRRKALSFMEFVGDHTEGSILQVRASDDDYRSWTNFRKVDLGQKRPVLINNGSFAQRAYNFRHKCNTPLRIEAVELQFDMGSL